MLSTAPCAAACCTCLSATSSCTSRSDQGAPPTSRVRWPRWPKAAAGLAALGLWRLAETVVGPHPSEHSGQDQGAKRITKRLKSFGLAVVYLAIAFSAAKFAVSSGEASTTRNTTLSAELMQSGWGKFLLVVIGVAIVAVGGYHVYKGATKRFLKDLTVPGGPVLHRWASPAISPKESCWPAPGYSSSSRPSPPTRRRPADWTGP